MDTSSIRWGTTATHKLGDVSRPHGDFFIVEDYRPTTDVYVGEWASGYGFIEVEFPAETTRPLTAAEADFLSTRVRVV